MEHPIYELKISDNIDDNAEVSTVAFVDFPAIKRDFLQFAGEKISFDYDDTLSTTPGKELAKKEIEAGNDVYIISARQNKDGMMSTANDLGISENKVYATGSNKAKVEKVKELGITKHYDNNTDVIKELGTIGSKFNLMQNFGGPGSGPQGGGENSDIMPDLKSMSDNELQNYQDKESKKAKELSDKKKKLFPNPDITTAMSPEEKSLTKDIAKHYENANSVIKEKRDRIKKAKELVNSRINFAIQNEDKRIVTGALMIPEQLIYRKSEKFGEHYVKFSADTIKDISIKFAKKGFQKNVNLMHDEALTVEGVTMFESFLSDKSRGIAPIAAFSDLPDGTWFGSFYVENNDVWQLIKENKVKGFSVEGMFDYVQPLSSDEQKLQEFKKLMDTF